MKKIVTIAISTQDVTKQINNTYISTSIDMIKII